MKLLSKNLQGFDDVQVGKREDIPIEKGAVLGEDFFEKNQDLVEKYCNFFTAYPDLFLDLIKPVDSSFSFFFYQRIVLRALMRYKIVYISACRAFSKSFLTILALFLQCVFMPGTKRFICAPYKNQGAQIAKEKLTEIFRLFPLLRREVIGGSVAEVPGNYGKDYVTLRFRNGSEFTVVGAADSTRGGRRHGGLLDELRDHDEKDITEIVLPLMNVSRRLPDNTVNPKEPNQQQAIMTSAGARTSYAYDKLIDCFETAIIEPDRAFVMGCDYRVPMMHGLIDRSYINGLKMSPSYNEESFAREYMSSWGGGDSESWFNFDKISKYRKLKNPELHASSRLTKNQFYLISVDKIMSLC